MSTLSISGEVNDVPLQGLENELLFLVEGDEVKHGLNRVCPLLVAAYLDEILLNNSEDEEPLVAGAGRQQLLTEIVSIVVNHEITEMFMDLIQEELDDLMGGLVQLLLKEPTSSLFKGKFVDVASNDFKFLLLVLALLKLLDDLLHQLLVTLRSQMKWCHATSMAAMAPSRRIRAYFHEGVWGVVAT